MARGARVINRHNCTGCHVLEMPKFEIPAGTKVAEAFTDFKTNLRSSYNSRANDYLAELYPGLTHDPKKKLDAGLDRERAGPQARRRLARSRSRGCRPACSRTS